MKKIEELNFIGGGRTVMVLEAIRDLRERVGPDFPVLGGVTGPFTLINYLIGLAKTMLLSRRDPVLLKDFSKISASVANYAKEMVSAGADAIVIEDGFITGRVQPRYLQVG